MVDPKICNSCCEYTDNFIDKESVCLNCHEYKTVNREKRKMSKPEFIKRKEAREKRVLLALGRMCIIFFMFNMIGCTKVMTNKSKPFVDVQQGLTEVTESLNQVAKKVDILADLQKEISLKVGLGTEQYDNQKRVSTDTKELLAIIKQNEEDAKKDREANAEILKSVIAALKVIAPVAGQVAGIPAPLTQAGLSLTDALLGAGGTGVAVKLAQDFFATRRKRKDEEEWEEYCQKLKDDHENDKEEMKASLLIKQRRDGKLPSEDLDRKKEATREAIAELKAEGKI